MGTRNVDGWVNGRVKRWTHLHRQAVSCGSKTRRHSRKPLDQHLQNHQVTTTTATMLLSLLTAYYKKNHVNVINVTFSPKRWKSRLQPNLNRQLLVFHSLLKILKNLNADILDPRTGIARPLIGVSMAGQAPFDGDRWWCSQLGFYDEMKITKDGALCIIS